MANESVEFDFIGRGAENLAADFRKTGDNAVLAAKGARLLADAEEKQRRAADAAAGATLAMARADKILADAEDEAIAKSVEDRIATEKEAAATKKAAGEKKKAAGETKSAAGGMSMFGKAVLAANVATGVGEPLVAGMTVSVAALGSALAAAGAGIGVFGLVAKSVLTQASQASQKASSAQDQYTASVKAAHLAYSQAMDSATKKSQRQAAAAKLQAAEQSAQVARAKALTLAYSGLTPAQERLSKSLAQVTGEWHKFTATATPGVARTLAQAFRLVPDALKMMQPFLAPVENALHIIIGNLGGALRSPFWRQFVAYLSASADPALQGLAKAAGHVIHGIAGIIEAFGPFASSVVGGLDKATAKFAKWGETLSSHSGFKALVTMARQDAPKVITVLKNLGVSLRNFGSAMAGISTPGNSRQLLDLLVRMSGILDTLTRNKDLDFLALYAYAAAGAMGRLRVAWKAMFGESGVVAGVQSAWKAIVKFAAAAEGATVAQTLAAAATKAWDLAMSALPWVAIAAAVIALTVVIIKYHKQIWAFVVRIWHDVTSFVKRAWHDILRFAEQWWPLILGPSGVIIKYHKQIWAYIQRAWHDVTGFLSRTWHDVLRGAQSAWGGIIHWFTGLPGRILHALTGLGTSLWNFGHMALTKLWNGVKAVAKGILNWFSGFAHGVVSIFRKIWGWLSPSTVMFAAGRDLMLGLEKGIKAHAHRAQAAVAAVGGKVSGSVSSWISKALSITREPSSWGPLLAALVARESGGNPKALNPTPVLGQHASGIAQTLPSTFAAYGMGGSIWNPVDDLVAAIRYIAAVYKTPANIPGLVSGGYKGYDSGGLLMPGLTLAVNRTGRPEQVIPAGRGGAQRVVVEFDFGGTAERDFVRLIRKSVRLRGGGDVQAVYGRH